MKSHQSSLTHEGDSLPGEKASVRKQSSVWNWGPHSSLFQATSLRFLDSSVNRYSSTHQGCSLLERHSVWKRRRRSCIDITVFCKTTVDRDSRHSAETKSVWRVSHLLVSSAAYPCRLVQYVESLKVVQSGHFPHGPFMFSAPMRSPTCEVDSAGDNVSILAVEVE